MQGAFFILRDYGASLFQRGCGSQTGKIPSCRTPFPGSCAKSAPSPPQAREIWAAPFRGAGDEGHKSAAVVEDVGTQPSRRRRGPRNRTDADAADATGIWWTGVKADRGQEESVKEVV